MESSLFSYRREVYRILQEEGIDLPRYAVLNRDPDKPDGESASSPVTCVSLRFPENGRVPAASQAP